MSRTGINEDIMLATCKDKGCLQKKKLKENDIRQKGTRGSSQNHAFVLLGKNDKIQRGGWSLLSLVTENL